MQFLSKISTFVLIAHLLVATSGVPLVYHFCGEKIDSVSIGKAKQCACNHDDANDENSCCEKDCCHDELAVSKLNLDFLLVSSLIASELLATPLVAMLPFLLATPPQSPIHAITLVDHSPPHRPSDIPVLFRSLLI
jgi:hypothetical protein